VIPADSSRWEGEEEEETLIKLARELDSTQQGGGNRRWRRRGRKWLRRWGKGDGEEKDGGGALGQRSAAEPGTESGDGYRGSSAIIGAESSSFFPSSSFFLPPFFFDE